MRKTEADSIIEKTRLGYDSIADEFSKTRQRIWPDVAVLLGRIEPCSKVLEVGCGNGRIFSYLKDKNIEYTGIDNSEKLINIANSNYGDIKNARFMLGSALDLPFVSDSFDYVISVAVLHHIPSDDNRTIMMHEAKRVVKSDGQVIVTVWNLWQKKYYGYIIDEAVRKMTGRSKLDFGDCFIPWKRGTGMMRYCHAFTVHGLVKLARRAGLKLVDSGKTEKNDYKPNIYLIAKK